MCGVLNSMMTAAALTYFFNTYWELDKESLECQAEAVVGKYTENPEDIASGLLKLSGVYSLSFGENSEVYMLLGLFCHPICYLTLLFLHSVFMLLLFLLLKADFFAEAGFSFLRGGAGALAISLAALIAGKADFYSWFFTLLFIYSLVHLGVGAFFSYILPRIMKKARTSQSSQTSEQNESLSCP